MRSSIRTVRQPARGRLEASRPARRATSASTRPCRATSYIKAFRPLSPLGTHHTVLTPITGASPADGIVPVQRRHERPEHDLRLGRRRAGLRVPRRRRPPPHGGPAPPPEPPPLQRERLPALRAARARSYEEATAARCRTSPSSCSPARPSGSRFRPACRRSRGTCQLSNVTNEPIQRVRALAAHAQARHAHEVGDQHGSPELVLQDEP